MIANTTKNINPSYKPAPLAWPIPVAPPVALALAVCDAETSFVFFVVLSVLFALEMSDLFWPVPAASLEPFVVFAFDLPSRDLV